MSLFEKINSFFSATEEENDELLALFDDSEEIEEIGENITKVILSDEEEDVEEGDFDE